MGCCWHVRLEWVESIAFECLLEAEVLRIFCESRCILVHDANSGGSIGSKDPIFLHQVIKLQRLACPAR